MSFSRPTIHDVSRIRAETYAAGSGEISLELIFEDDEMTPEGYAPTRITIYGLESVLAHRIAQAINQASAPEPDQAIWNDFNEAALNEARDKLLEQRRRPMEW